MEVSLQQAIEIAEKRNYSLMTLIYDGTQECNSNPRSTVYRIGKYCVKYYIRSKAYDFTTEVKNLRSLSEYNFAPKLFHTDEKNYFILMEFIEGVSLGSYGIKNLDTNQQQQLTHIKHQLDSMGIYYEKEEYHCLVEPTGRLRFIDFNI